MRNVLDHIIQYKRQEVERSKREVSLEELLSVEKVKRPSLAQSLSAKPGIIAEFKRKSPSRGIINDHSTIEEVTKGYSDCGAAALSILTDTPSFGGGLSDLKSALDLDIPLLRKEFIIDKYQIAESRAHGASIILLIAACLSKQEVFELAKFASELELEVLLEIHEEEELKSLNEFINLAGINNRNLKDFSVDIERSLRLREKLPHHLPAIAESGINTAEEIKTFINAGFKGFLIGDLFMRQPNPVAAFKNLMEELK